MERWAWGLGRGEGAQRNLPGESTAMERPVGGGVCWMKRVGMEWERDLGSEGSGVCRGKRGRRPPGYAEGWE